MPNETLALSGHVSAGPLQAHYAGTSKTKAYDFDLRTTTGETWLLKIYCLESPAFKVGDAMHTIVDRLSASSRSVYGHNVGLACKIRCIIGNTDLSRMTPFRDPNTKEP